MTKKLRKVLTILTLLSGVVNIVIVSRTLSKLWGAKHMKKIDE